MLFQFRARIFAYTTVIPYIFIHVRSHNCSYFQSLPYQFKAFPGEFLYDGKLIDRSLLQNCDALIESFNDSRFKLYEKTKSQTAYIEEVNSKRERTIVFSYKEYYLDLIILY
ncbi:MAG: hypothetical protein HC763_14365 [Hydrococcus sp. CRU_1_1]|nr:hypothetical protein [Hydrococcus sp. CRU_1_1]